MKDGWYGDWECAHDFEIDDHDYVEQAVSRLKAKIKDSLKYKQIAAIEDEETIVRKANRLPFQEYSLELASPLDKGTIGWKGYFKFVPWMVSNE
jgi:hypothetical protein